MKILFSLLLCAPLLAKTQTNKCFDEKEFHIRHEIEMYQAKVNWKVLELVSIKDEKHYIAITNSSECFINKNSLLSTNEVEGYATNYIKKNRNGFSYSFEYGSRYRYDYILNFKFINGNFYLYKIVEKYSDLSNPNTQKIRSKLIKNISFEWVNIHSYIKP